MSRMRLWISAAIIAFVVLVIFALSVPHTSDVEVPTALLPETESIPSIVLHDSFKKGVHTISGSVEAPNACASVSASATLVGDASDKDGILVDVSVLPDSGICLQIPTRVDFKTTISAQANLPLTATVNGVPASTTPS